MKIGSWGGAALAVVGMLIANIAGAQTDQTKSQVFKSWTLECVTPKLPAGSTAAPKAFCRIGHDVHSPSDATKVQLIARARYVGTDRKPWFILVLPPEANLQAGIRFQVDKATGYHAKIQSCYPSACNAVFPLTDDLLKQFKSGTDLKLEFIANPQTDIKLAIPLAGFGAALEALQKTGS